MLFSIVDVVVVVVLPFFTVYFKFGKCHFSCHLLCVLFFGETPKVLKEIGRLVSSLS